MTPEEALKLIRDGKAGCGDGWESFQVAVRALDEKVAREKAKEPERLCVAGGALHRVSGLSPIKNGQVACEDCGFKMPVAAFAKEPERPGLEEQEKCLRQWGRLEFGGNVYQPDVVTAAADTLRLLREEIVPWLQSRGSDRALELVRNLGCQ